MAEATLLKRDNRTWCYRKPLLVTLPPCKVSNLSENIPVKQWVNRGSSCDSLMIPLASVQKHNISILQYYFLICFTYSTAQLASIRGWIDNKKKCLVFRCDRKNPTGGKPLQSGRDCLLNPYARLWSEVGFEPGFTEVKGRKRNHWANLIPLI